MSTAEEFLEAARTLTLADSAGLGHFRRAISTAYYAAFHATVEASVSVLFASAIAVEESKRWFEHGKIADVARAIASAPIDAKRVAEWVTNGSHGIGFDSEPSMELRLFGRRMRDLYDQRQTADYFGQAALTLGMGTAIVAIDSAERVCSQLSAWSNNGDVAFERVALAMLSKSVGAKKR
jgi:uncharacterized protein (UPF0332 family)